MKLELKRISIWPAIRLTFVINLILGFLIGLLYSFFIMLIAMIPSQLLIEETENPFLPVAGAVAILMPFFFAFFFAVIYTIAVAIGALLYNLFARLVGGLEFQFKAVLEHVAPAPSPVSVTPITPPPSPEQPPYDS